MGKEIKVTSKQVVDIIEKYREKLGISNFHIYCDSDDKEFNIIFKNKQGNRLKLSINFIENTFGFQKWESVFTKFKFEEISSFKLLVELIEELNKIVFIKLPEFMEYVETERKKKKLEEEIENIIKAQEELEKQLEQKRNELWRNR